MSERILSRWHLRLLWNGIIFGLLRMGFNQRSNVIKHTIFLYLICFVTKPWQPLLQRRRRRAQIDASAANKHIFRSLEAARVTQPKMDDELMTMSSHTRTTNIDRLFSASLLAHGRAFVSSQKINYSVDYQSVMSATTEPQTMNVLRNPFRCH